MGLLVYWVWKKFLEDLEKTPMRAKFAMSKSAREKE
jgi:hypothetical protein